MQYEPIRILMIEDNMADVALTRAALAATKLLVELDVASDGDTALSKLLRKPPFHNALLPDLILLDLNLPGKSGKDVLAEIKNEPEILHIPVVILSTSNQEKDILESYRLQANCFITKPPDMDQFRYVISQMKEFWFAVVRIPKVAEFHD